METPRGKEIINSSNNDQSDIRNNNIQRPQIIQKLDISYMGIGSNHDPRSASNGRQSNNQGYHTPLHLNFQETIRKIETKIMRDAT
jgi:hypothetical protein